MRLRCPHCKNAIEIVPDAPTEPLTCPSCGSHLDFLNETLTHRPSEPRSVAHFLLLELLGVGHFGEVWMAHDTQLDRTVAVKIPRTQDLTAASVEMFLREARAAAQLRHPHIVPVHEVGRDGDTLYIVSDFIRGVPLASYLTEHRYAPREAAALCATVAEALHHAHEAGVVHRDLKPGNIMLDGENQPHLMDFGLAKRQSGEITQTVAGKILGTPAYMSPEQARGEGHRADRKSDVYSLGVTLYELLTGERPFKGDSQLLLHQVINEEPRPPRKRDPRVPRDLETICLKALAKRPEKRYATAQEMAADLHRYLRGEPIMAKRVGRVERAWRWSRRNRFKSAAAVVVAVLVSLLAAASWDNHRRRVASAPILRTVQISSEPPGARMAFVLRDPDTGEPMPDRVVRADGQKLIELQLTPGDYLVVAKIPDFGFHEVYRHVPSPAEKQGGPLRHNRWNELSGGQIVLPAVKIKRTAEVNRGMVRFEGGTFEMGSPKVPGAPLHSRTIPAFLLDPTEVTVEQARETDDVPPAMEREFGELSDHQAVTFISPNEATAYAENIGKRLPSEAEYEFAANAAGTSEFPWGDSAKLLDDWKFGDVGKADDEAYFDRTSTTPPVFGLYSNVAECTDSWPLPYPDSPPFPTELIQLSRSLRVVRGGPMSVVNRQPLRDEYQLGPRWRHGLAADAKYSGLGFRCARSAEPRFLK